MDTFNNTIKETLQSESDKLSSDFPYDELLLSTNPLQRAKSDAEKHLIKHTLKIFNNNHTETAKKLNICLSSLYSKIWIVL